MGSRRDRKDIYRCAPLRLLQPCDPIRRIDDRMGIWHAANGGKSSSRSGGSAGGDSFLVTLAGLAQMDMQVDEARRNDQAPCIEFLVCVTTNLVGWSNFSHAAVAQKDVHGSIDPGGRIDHMATLYEEA